MSDQGQTETTYPKNTARKGRLPRRAVRRNLATMAFPILDTLNDPSLPETVAPFDDPMSNRAGEEGWKGPGREGDGEGDRVEREGSSA